jgi:hypothetical protein
MERAHAAFVIDPSCCIAIIGKGFCWAPSKAWGMSDDELCENCMLKHKTCRYCGRGPADVCPEPRCTQAAGVAAGVDLVVRFS